MRSARFLVDGREHRGTPAGEGLLVDEDGRSHREGDVTFLPPVPPRTVLALALNYAEHAAELDMADPEEPALFLKPPNTWVGHRTPVLYPAGAEYVHYEVELAVVIGRRGRRVPAVAAMDLVKGYTIANDLVVRDFVGNFYRPPVKAKGWDTFCPMGPFLVTADEVPDPHDLELRAYVNGELRQKGHTGGMIRRIPELIEHVTGFMTLEENDVILTGTPKGVSHVYPGDVMRLEIDGLGALENPIVEETQ
jgi:5-oxopent-3-ene-1,2,5-tricarboxylate decarboxylase / 2-hydroxyhepta-2,4-diene-1,7-dioate isomerase